MCYCLHSVPLYVLYCRSIKAFADKYLEMNLPIHMLVNNGGVFLVNHDHTQEGFEVSPAESCHISAVHCLSPVHVKLYKPCEAVSKRADPSVIVNTLGPSWVLSLHNVLVCRPLWGLTTGVTST